MVLIYLAYQIRTTGETSPTLRQAIAAVDSLAPLLEVDLAFRRAGRHEDRFWVEGETI